MALYLTYLGLVFLSLSLDKHYKEVISGKIRKSRKIASSILGTIFLLCSLILLIKDNGLSLGITYWTGYIGISIVFIAMVYSFIPKELKKVSVFLLALTLTFIII